jgi:hypothetical protein
MRPFLSYELDPRWNVVAVTFCDHPKVEEAMVGRSILSFVSDPTLAHLLRSLFERVTVSRGSVNVYYRCDTPTIRRRCSMMTRYQYGSGQGVLTVDNLFLTQEPRKAMRLLEPGAPVDAGSRSPSVVRMCSWCKRVHGPEERWIEVEDAMNRMANLQEAPLPAVSHSMCPDCRGYVLREVEEQAG